MLQSCNLAQGYKLLYFTNFFSILAESSHGSMTSTAHPMDSSAFKFSNNSSLFSSFRVFESENGKRKKKI